MKTTNELTVRLPHRTDTWHVTADCVALAEPIATKLNVTTKQLLIGLSHSRYELGEAPIDADSVPAGLRVTLPDDEDLRKRITRAAAIENVSVEQLMWAAVASDISCIEESRIFDADGSVIGDTLPLQEFRTFRMVGKERSGLNLLNDLRH